jgi:hypothetical protein
MTDPPSTGRRFATVAVTVIAVGLLSYAAIRSNRWLVTGTGSGFGLRTFQTCTQYGCDHKPAAEVVAELARTTPALVKSGFLEAGWVTLIAILAGCGLLVVPIVPILAGFRSGLARTASRLASFALMVALGGAVVFVLRRPGGTSNGAFDVGFSFYVFAVGNVLGLTAGQMLAKLHAPADPG